jgi:hypothetical protein
MDKFLRFSVFTVLFLFGVFSIYAVENFGAEGAKNDNDLTLEDMLTYAIQDEYLARAEYYTIMDKFGNVRPFSNIVKAEETHISELIPLFQRYAYKVPADTAKEHTVIPDSIQRALITGVQAEVDNIAMYELFLKKNIPEEAAAVFKNLLKGSESHLKAFNNGLRRY